MSIKQIATIIQCVRDVIGENKAVKITDSQFIIIKEAVEEHCAPGENIIVYSAIKRIGRRLERQGDLIFMGDGVRIYR